MRNLFILLCIIPSFLFSQTGIIKGKVLNSINNEPIPFANVSIQNSTIGAQTDIDGNYEIKDISPGLYNVVTTYIGYKTKLIYEVEVTNAKPAVVNFLLEEDAKSLDIVEVTASPFNKTEESPVSLKTIGTSEIERNPGGNRDISKVIQSLPGVATIATFRNDIVIRGGAPNENRFYLDGVEVPNINHFATQGSSGGPVGMINVNFIREVDFYSGAFPANRGNALSSVMEFKQKDGNTDKMRYSGTIGASDFGLTVDGPLGKNATLIASVRRSYLQFLFKALELPFLPIYNDFQLKSRIKLSNKDELTIVGLGAIDNFELNTSANKTELQKYLLANLPVNEQWNYTGGINYKHFREKSFTTIVVSRNHLNNEAFKYFNNDDSDINNLIYKYNSQEVENKFRIENTYRNNGYKINFGAGVENVLYKNATYSKTVVSNMVLLINFNSKLTFNKYNLFAQVSKLFINQKLTLSLGLRSDFTDYSTSMANPLNQVSPRFSFSYSITPKLSFNGNVGRYYQLPAYTVLGYKDANGKLLNKENNVKYIQCDHLVSGFEYNTLKNSKITIEGFYKIYSNYPFSLRDSISLANLGADFGVIGNEEVKSISTGRAYGMEFMFQQKLFKGFYGIIAYTWVKSEFKTRLNSFAPSSWDNGNIVSLTAGKKFKKNWELGVKYRFAGGLPYTPYNVSLSSQKQIWDIRSQGVLDYSRLNSKRLGVFQQFDIRVDKKYYLKKVSMNFYLDIQNLFNTKYASAPYLLLDRDASGNAQTDPNNPNSYLLKEIENTGGNTLPTIGVIIEF